MFANEYPARVEQIFGSKQRRVQGRTLKVMGVMEVRIIDDNPLSLLDGKPLWLYCDL